MAATLAAVLEPRRLHAMRRAEPPAQPDLARHQADLLRVYGQVLGR